LAPPDTLELTDQLLKRAAAQSSESVPMLQADKLDIIDLVFNLSAYHHPDNINLPAGYISIIILCFNIIPCRFCLLCLVLFVLTFHELNFVCPVYAQHFLSQIPPYINLITPCLVARLTL
jgi:hypothetical protein